MKNFALVIFAVIIPFMAARPIPVSYYTFKYPKY